jgi:adenylyl-sulfate kinase
VLDGDHLRRGLNKDLGFSVEDRAENVRRVAEVSRLMNDAGLVVIVPVIAPFEADRQIAKIIIGEENFRLVYIKTPLEICEQRDPKGMYKKARALQIEHFTGITSPYEIPVNADLEIDTNCHSISESVRMLVRLLAVPE